MADPLSDMLVFVRAVEAGSLSAAARALNQSLPVVSRRLSRLEERLGVRLANRTTRAFTPTEEGLAYHARCARILAEIDEAELAVMRGKDRPVGLLRLTMPMSFARRLAPMLAEFASLHPDLKVHIDASDAVVNIVDEGYDLAVRFGALPDSALVGRQLAPNVRIICAAPSYLARKERPRRIEDLTHHDCIIYGTPPRDVWTFAAGTAVRVKGAVSVNNGELATVLAVEGAGLVVKSIWDVHEDIAAGRLEIVLPKQRLQATPIHAVYPHSKHAAAKVRLCVAFLADKLKKQALKLPITLL